MAKKEFLYRGKKLSELVNLTVKELTDIVPSRPRRSLKRGFTEEQKILLKKIDKGEQNIKTHCRDMVIIPKMVNSTIRVHNGKEFLAIIIIPEMIGHYLGEFVLTRKGVTHSSPGIGATRSSANISVK